MNTQNTSREALYSLTISVKEGLSRDTLPLRGYDAKALADCILGRVKYPI